MRRKYRLSPCKPGQKSVNESKPSQGFILKFKRKDVLIVNSTLTPARGEGAVSSRPELYLPSWKSMSGRSVCRRREGRR